jgi:LysM repeat protein
MASGRFWIGLVLWGALIVGVLGGGGYALHQWRETRIQDDLELVRRLMAEGDWAPAGDLLAPLLEADPRKPWYPEVQTLQLRLLIRTDPAAAREFAAGLVAPDSPATGEARARAHALLGRTALDAQDAAEARRHFDALLELVGPTGPGADEARLGLLRIRMATAGVSPELREELQGLIREFTDSPWRPEMEFALGQANLSVLKSPVPLEGDQIYSIQRGDTIYDLARKHGLSPELLMTVNGITDARMLSIGRRIKIPSVDFSIEVDKTSNTLTLFNHGEFFARYPVRTGHLDYLTPAGEFRIINKKKDPQWTDPKTHKTYPPNHPENELGTRWLGFQGASLGIHGTIHPESIGTYASNGCVGMLKEDVEELFDLVRVGTPIRIVGKIQNPDGPST